MARYHHKTPEFWLNSFSNDGQVYTYDKVLNKSFKLPPNRCAGQTKYYEIKSQLEEDSEYIEKELSKLESSFSEAYRKALDEDFIDSDEISTWCDFLVLQYCRTKLSEGYLKEEMQRFIKELEDDYYEIREKELYIDLFKVMVVREFKDGGINFYKDHVMSHFINSKSLYEKIRTKINQDGRIYVLKTSGEVDLIISDDPVIISFNVFAKTTGGFLSPSMICYAPLSNNRLVLMTTDKMLIKFLDEKPQILKKSQIYQLNMSQLIHADRQVYSMTQQGISSIESIPTALYPHFVAKKHENYWWRMSEANGFSVHISMRQALDSLQPAV